MIGTHRIPDSALVIYETVENTETVSIGVWFPFGSRDETSSTLGYSHFLEHLLFKGTSNRTGLQIAQEIDRVGGILNAFTEKEATCFFCTLPKNYINLAIDVLSDMILNSILDPGEIEKEKMVVINEIKGSEDNAEEQAYQMYFDELWNKHRLTNRIIGNVGNIKNIERNDLYSFYRNRYTSINAIISISGNFKTENVLTHIENSFPPDSNQMYQLARRPPQQRSSWKIEKNKFNQVHIYTGFTYFQPAGLEEYTKTLLISTAFGESMSSRLFQRIRENQGLCYTIYCYQTHFADIALWTIYTNSLPESVPQLIDAINKELRCLLKDSFHSFEIEDAKSHLKGTLILLREDMETRMRRLFKQYIFLGDVYEFDKSIDIIGKVTFKNVNELIYTLINKDKFNLLAYGSRSVKLSKINHFDF